MQKRPDNAAVPQREQPRLLFLKCEEDNPPYDQTVYHIEVQHEDERFWYGYRVGLPRPLAEPIQYPKFAWKSMPRTRAEIPPGNDYQEALDDPFVVRRDTRFHEHYQVMRVLERSPYGTILCMVTVAEYTGYRDLEQARAAALGLVGTGER
jgi:hypothetical protein